MANVDPTFHSDCRYECPQWDEEGWCPLGRKWIRGTGLSLFYQFYADVLYGRTLMSAKQHLRFRSAGVFTLDLDLEHSRQTPDVGITSTNGDGGLMQTTLHVTVENRRFTKIYYGNYKAWQLRRIAT